MKPIWRRALLLSCALVAPAPYLSATCGGGGGGGLGGMPIASGGGQEEVFVVPWKIYGPSTPLPGDALVHVLWFPTGPAEAKASRLRASRLLSLYGARCVAMDLVTDNNTALREKYNAPPQTAQVVFTAQDGSELGRVASGPKGFDVYEVEKVLSKTLDSREEALKQQLKEAKTKQEAGDKAAATATYQQVLGWKCLFPKPAKEAAKALKELGVPVAGLTELDTPFPILHGDGAQRVIRLMDLGYRAENLAHYREAEHLYLQASRVDPADPAPLRFLGELHRHHTGEWDLAKADFRRILSMPADPLSRAVALHGLGKMSIFGNEFDKGLTLFHQSVDAFPLALTYRNLAVYWNDRDAAKAEGYMRQALALDPDDSFNLIFSATYLASHGQREEALKIAKANEGTLCASYNLAAIYALLGEKDIALGLLQRHFYQFERYDAVREKEMHEARVDIVFQSLRQDPRFIKLTKLAKG
ncbi:MAG TPA: hypothetical protein VFF76_09295 [Holophagaceae bacterium]|jgi:tetratricopeptide (TPR) repeat protein|nr:hypothetical protein [Holophagaceae bacterium]